MQKIGGLFQRVRTVGDDHTTYIVLSQMMLNTACQLCPDFESHIFAVNLRNLLAQQTIKLRQARNSCYQLSDAQLGGGITKILIV